MISRGVFQPQQFCDSGDKDIVSGYVTLSLLKAKSWGFFLTLISVSAFNLTFSNMSSIVADLNIEDKLPSGLV